MKQFRIYISACVILLTGMMGVRAQQMPQFTQYMMNSYVINPAVAGTYNHYKIKLNGRYQWLGFPESAPQDLFFSVYGPSETQDMGWGGLVYSDVTGPTSRLGMLGSYAYNVSLHEDMRLSMGASLGVNQYKISFSQLNSGTNNYDPKLPSVDQAAWVPDANIGLYLWSTSYYAGFSAHQLIRNKLDLVEDIDSDTISGINRLKVHFYMTGGYAFILSDEYILETFAMVKGLTPVPIQWELSAKMTYDRMFWGGISYRHKDALSFLTGISYEKYGLGISYDFLLSEIRRWGTGSVEIMISYRFDDIK